MSSPISFSKKIRTLCCSKIVVSKATKKRCLTDKIWQKTYRPAKKPRLTPSMKAKRYAFAKTHLDWTTENWRKVLFSNESTVQQFTSRRQLVRRPVGARYENHYIIQTMKHIQSIMVWGAMSANCTAGLCKLEILMMVHDCNVFIQDDTPSQVSKKLSKGEE